MVRHHIAVRIVCLVHALGCLTIAQAQQPATSPILLKMVPGSEKRLIPTSEQVTVARSEDVAAPGINVTIQPGSADYPGIRFSPEGTPSWNLSRFGHVEARLANTGSKAITVALRVDNAGNWQDNPWNTESVSLLPGASGTVKVIFGYAYGQKPSYALKPGAVTNLLLFTTKTDTAQSFRIESVEAGGPAGEKPPTAPGDVRIKPVGGKLLDIGTTVDPTTQLSAQGVKASVSGTAKQPALSIAFSASSGEQYASFKPPAGRWDLRDFTRVAVTVRNAGTTPIHPRVHLESNGGASEWVTAKAALSPGASTTISIPFEGTSILDLGKPETLTRITSDAVSAVIIGAEPAGDERVLVVESITATASAAHLPDWLGKRPPVAGDWVQTLDENFNGTAVNSAVWNVYGENYYDKVTHWSKDNVLVSGGQVRLRYSKKTGFQNDDPKRNSTQYAAGYLTTYERWAQRYGYFEARIKLPTAPGLWPAFWMMPDRGLVTGPEQWKRQSTNDGGMEFDTVEHLTRWGPHRYNIAMHYDGYEKDHKSLGSDKVYFDVDKDGYITAGLLWLPGLLVYYCNGNEVLRWENPRVASVPACFLFTLPSGGWDNNALNDASLPADFVIDYVRVWQRKDLASGK